MEQLSQVPVSAPTRTYGCPDINDKTPLDGGTLPEGGKQKDVLT